MYRWDDTTRNSIPGSEKPTKYGFLAGWIAASCLIFFGLLAFAGLVHAYDQRPSAVTNQSASADPHSAVPEIAALREYARQIGSEQLNPAANRSSPHPRFEPTDLVQLREYARDVGIESAAPTTNNETKPPHPHFDSDDIAAVEAHVRQARGGRTGPKTIPEARGPHPHFDDPELAALRDYAGQVTADQPGSPKAPSFQVAEADNALDAFRDLLRKGSQPAPAPKAVPDAAPRRPVPSMTRGDPAFVNAHRLGSQTCLSCHAVQAEAFSKTLMGRIAKTQPAKFDCENCHGPGSAHIQAVGCAACHGEGGITRRPGIPSLVGQDPQYLVPAMKAYATGQRKHDLMRLVLSGMGDAEMRNIASYYARQIPDRAKTPLIGDASAGKSATALCANCHGDRGVSVAAAWPSLAGQDAQYLADAIQGYKTGSRSKAIACAGCHGEGGISRKPGMPSLAGMDPQYLVPAMKAYASGERKHGLMKALLSGVDDAQFNSIASFYSHQIPARAQTPAGGDASAGKSAATLCVGCHGEAGGSIAAAISRPCRSGRTSTSPARSGLTGTRHATRPSLARRATASAASAKRRECRVSPGLLRHISSPR